MLIGSPVSPGGVGRMSSHKKSETAQSRTSGWAAAWMEEEQNRPAARLQRFASSVVQSLRFPLLLSMLSYVSCCSCFNLICTESNVRESKHVKHVGRAAPMIKDRAFTAV